jgi:hypothetical protein
MIAVQVWQGDKTLVDKACVDGTAVATEADLLLDACCSTVDRIEQPRAAAD